MANAPLIDKSEALEHARYSMNDILKFSKNGTPSTEQTLDFVDAVHSLSAILKLLDYSNLQADFVIAVKTI